MDILYFYQIVAAVLVGNTLTAWFVHSVWVITKVEKTGKPASSAPWGAFIGAIIPPLTAVAAVYFVTA